MVTRLAAAAVAATIHRLFATSSACCNVHSRQPDRYPDSDIVYELDSEVYRGTTILLIRDRACQECDRHSDRRDLVE